MHRLLKRQISRHLGGDFDASSASPEMLKFFESISLSYDELYNEKKFLEHTIDMNSQDLEKANKKITEQNQYLQKLVEKTSDENEEVMNLLKQYKHAIDASLIVSTTDLHGRIKYVNENFCKISGYSKEELLGKSHNIVRDPKNTKKFFEEMWNTILGKKVWQGVFPNRAKSGTTYYVNATIIPLLNTNGEIVEFMAFREDITKMIEYQDGINAEKHRVSEILNNQESIIAVFNRQDGITEVNKKFYEIFGFTSLSSFKQDYSCICELFEKRDNFLKPSKDDFFWATPILDEPDKVHLAMIHQRVYSVKVAIIYIDNQETYLVTLTDITEIEEARIKSKEAEIAKANFLANMSHEIRTPMNAILGFSELLSKTELDARQNKFVDLIKNSSTTLIKIINDILDFSKLENRQVEIDPIPINPFMEFEETFLLLSQRAKEKEISYTISIDNTLEECIEIDSFHIKQILINLIGNAIKFTPKHGAIEIKIEKRTKESQKIIRFSVRDTGIGIPQDRQNKIFEPFSQADSSTTREFGGTGLGLSISNSLVGMLGSKLELQSTVDVGSIFFFDIAYKECSSSHTLKKHLDRYSVYLCTFDNQLQENLAMQLNAYGISFTNLSQYNEKIDLQTSVIIATNEKFTTDFKKAKVLLLSKEYAPTNEQNRHNIELFTEFPSILYNELMRLNLIDAAVKSTVSVNDLHLKVLVAEDYDINRILISELLGQFNIEHEFAFNGQEAIEKVKLNQYDLIFMDINMPIMNGMDATKIIVNELHVKTPIIALTANALEGDKERFLALGMVDYLSKPINTKALESLLVRYSKNISLGKNASDKKEFKKMTLDIKSSLILSMKKMSLPEQIIAKLFDSYIGSLQEIQNNLQKSIENLEFETIQINAHNLKSGADTLCFDALTTIAQELETNAKERCASFGYVAAFKKIKEYLDILMTYEK